MRCNLRRFGWASLLVSSTLMGCTKSAVQQKPVSDPLLVTKSPVEGRSHTTQASALRRSEPTPPPKAPDEKN
jgi:hypothetical protein